MSLMHLKFKKIYYLRYKNKIHYDIAYFCVIVHQPRFLHIIIILVVRSYYYYYFYFYDRIGL